jgi:oligopeptide transport system ATP-binding protein
MVPAGHMTIEDMVAESTARGEEHVAPLLSVRDLAVEVRLGQRSYLAVRDVSFDVDRGETIAIVGESGSGKSLTAQAVMGILPPRTTRLAGGRVLLRGRDILSRRGTLPKGVRGPIMGMVFQDPLNSLNPVLRIGEQVAEMYRVHQHASKSSARDQSLRALAEVGLPEPERRYDHYPHELSGGLRQRVMIAIALALKPSILIADEPTTALDVTIQAQIMELLAGLKREHGLALILITHDLALVAEHADRVIVLYAGSVMETGRLRDVYEQPGNPYSHALLNAVDLTGWRTGSSVIPGSPPDPSHRPPGCPFNPRCALAIDVCRREAPALSALTGVGGGSSAAGEALHRSACHRKDEVDRLTYVRP